MRPSRRLLAFIAASTILSVAAACVSSVLPDAPNEETAELATVELTPPNLTLFVGAKAPFAVVLKDVHGELLDPDEFDVQWTTSNEAVATVAKTSYARSEVTAVAPGTATVTMSVEGKTLTAQVTVTSVPVASVTLSPATASVDVGKTVQISAVARDASGGTLSNRPIVWTSSSTLTALVSGSGLVTGIEAGTATITATVEGKTATAQVTVLTVPVASVAVTPGSPSVDVGKTVQLSAVTKDASGATLANRPVTWSSSNTGFATVSGSGLVSGVAPGTVTITATSEGKSGTSTVTVKAVTAPVASVTVSPTSSSIEQGSTTPLTATLKDASGNVLTGRSIAWTSSATGTATVSSSGVVTGIAAGTVTITATSEGKNGTASVTVTASAAPVATVTVTPSTLGVQVGSTGQLTATAKDAAGNALTGRTVTWTSSATGTATVSSTGLVSGVAAGTATITATSEGKSGTSTITVTAVPTGGFVFVGAGDIADCGNSTDELTADLLDRIAGQVFTLGDNVYDDGSATEFANCYDPSWGRHKARTRPATGNHDYHQTDAKAYFDYFNGVGSTTGPAGERGKGYYSYDLGAWHIITINSSIDVGATSAQVTWLKADLAASTKQCTIALWHHPRFSSGKHGNATNMQPIWQVLYDAGVEMVLNGHDHTYERFAPQTPTGVADPVKGIREFVIGTGGAGLYAFGTIVGNSEVRNNKSYGVMKFVLSAGSYTWEFVPAPGSTFTDTGSGTCH